MKYRTYLQHDQRDCGAACLATIANFYKNKISLSYARQICKTDHAGTNLYGVESGAKKLGFNAVTLYGDYDELMQELSNGTIQYPFIAHTIDQNNIAHFIVVFRMKNDFFVCGDPAVGTVKLSSAEFKMKWTGYVVSMCPDTDFPGKAPKLDSKTAIRKLLQGCWKKIAVIAFLSVLVASIGIASSFVFQIVIDNQLMYAESDFSELETDMIDPNIEESHDHQHEEELEGGDILLSMGNAVIAVEDALTSPSLSIIFLSILTLCLIQIGIQFARGKLVLSLSKTIDLRLSLEYFCHLQDMDIAQIRVLSTGEYMSRLADAAVVRDAVATMAVSSLLDVIAAIGCGIILYDLNAKMFLITAAIISLYAILVLCYRKPLEYANRSVMQNNAEVQGYFKETIDGIETIRSSSSKSAIKKSASQKYHALADAVVHNGLLNITLESISGALEVIGSILVLWAGFTLISHKILTLGTLMTFYVLLNYFTTPVKNLINLQPELQKVMIAVERLWDVMEIPVEEENKPNDLPDQIDTWSMKDVSFRYSNHERTIENASICIHAGDTVAIVGESGCGKTTLAKLFLCFYEPEEGCVCVNDTSISDYSLDSIRSTISYVSQDAFLFSDTIRNNLTLGLKYVSQEEMEQVCRICCLNDFLQCLPLGLDTALEENGSNLSGGQRQRLVIARALLKKPKFLILDEATSNLDAVTENKILSAISEYFEKTTCLIISHKISRLSNCKYIYVMRNGRIIEEGTHEQLCTEDTYFAKLLANQ